jgi:hypothetical protein
MTDAPGWDAIDEALSPIYGEREPEHFGTLIRWRLGGPDPLDGLSAYERADPPHFHIIGYGLTELYEKEEKSAPDESGWGFELTFRVARGEGESGVPHWALGFLQNLARYVCETGNAFGPGHYMDLNGPIALAHDDTDIRAICFADDPELAPRDTPNGKMRFLQVVGVTLDELAVARRWNTEGLVSILRLRSPLLVTDLSRRSIMRDAEVLKTVENGVMKDGSSCAVLFLTDAELESNDDGGVVLSIAATTVRDLVDVVPGRIPFGRTLVLATSKARLVLEPGETLACKKDDEATTLVLPATVALALAKTLRPLRGKYDIAPGLCVVVRPSEIRDRDGNVVEVVG